MYIMILFTMITELKYMWLFIGHSSLITYFKKISLTSESSYEDCSHNVIDITHPVKKMYCANFCLWCFPHGDRHVLFPHRCNRASTFPCSFPAGPPAVAIPPICATRVFSSIFQKSAIECLYIVVTTCVPGSLNFKHSFFKKPLSQGCQT